jgi:hypothetical protein
VRPLGESGGEWESAVGNEKGRPIRGEPHGIAASH